ncbi:uncharacterized protein LOC135392516 [Ornithodoros turicata]|uniref:uncharacterized protein LOC135392516 n=1 Tax=Ornithodoros turicata TaxID=34597 RepID=UPI00313A31AB
MSGRRLRERCTILRRFLVIVAWSCASETSADVERRFPPLLHPFNDVEAQQVGRDPQVSAYPRNFEVVGVSSKRKGVQEGVTGDPAVTMDEDKPKGNLAIRLFLTLRGSAHRGSSNQDAPLLGYKSLQSHPRQATHRATNGAKLSSLFANSHTIFSETSRHMSYNVAHRDSADRSSNIGVERNALKSLEKNSKDAKISNPKTRANALGYVDTLSQTANSLLHRTDHHVRQRWERKVHCCDNVSLPLSSMGPLRSVVRNYVTPRPPALTRVKRQSRNCHVSPGGCLYGNQDSFMDTSNKKCRTVDVVTMFEGQRQQDKKDDELKRSSTQDIRASFPRNSLQSPQPLVSAEVASKDYGHYNVSYASTTVKQKNRNIASDRATLNLFLRAARDLKGWNNQILRNGRNEKRPQPEEKGTRKRGALWNEASDLLRDVPVSRGRRERRDDVPGKSSSTGTEPPLPLPFTESARVEGCRCKLATNFGANLNGSVNCRCVGDSVDRIPADLGPNVTKLTLEWAPIQVVRRGALAAYQQSLEALHLYAVMLLQQLEPGCFDNLTLLREISIQKAPCLAYIAAGVLSGLPNLRVLRITHSSLESVPSMHQLKSHNYVSMLDFDSNRINVLETGCMAVKAGTVILNHNAIRVIRAYAFNGSAIAELQLRGNRRLTNIEEEAFVGLSNLIRLDLSETRLKELPTLGLEGIEVLELRDVPTLERFPSVYHFRFIREAHLTYPYHCCAFQFPEAHNPEEHQRFQQSCQKQGSSTENEAHNYATHKLVYRKTRALDKVSQGLASIGRTVLEGMGYIFRRRSRDVGQAEHGFGGVQQGPAMCLCLRPRTSLAPALCGSYLSLNLTALQLLVSMAMALMWTMQTVTIYNMAANTPTTVASRLTGKKFPGDLAVNAREIS